MLSLVYGRDAEVAEWVRVRAPHAEGGFEKYTTIGIERDGKLICGVVYNEYRGHSIHASIASSDPRWADRRTLFSIFAYPFIQLGCRRITTYCGATMHSVRRFNERLGFTQEGLLRSGFEDDDCVVFGMLREECRWIERTAHEEQPQRAERAGPLRHGRRADAAEHPDSACERAA